MDKKLLLQLRKATFAGILECKNALKENNNDIEKSISWLRQKGIIKAASKANRKSNEGVVAIELTKDKKKASVIEINSETDFVARNSDFQQFAKKLAQISIMYSSKEEFMNAKFNENFNVSEALINYTSVFGEKIILSKLKQISIKDGLLGKYIHNKIVDNIGSIISVVAIHSDIEVDEIQSLANDLSVHVASSNPQYLNEQLIPYEIIKKEEEIHKKSIDSKNKPDNIIKKIIKNKLDKFKDSICLIKQQYALDDSYTIEEIIEKTKVSYNSKSLKIVDFIRLKVGELD